MVNSLPDFESYTKALDESLSLYKSTHNIWEWRLLWMLQKKEATTNFQDSFIDTILCQT